MLFSVGMYLPLETTFAIFVGGLIRWFVDTFVKKRNSQGEGLYVRVTDWKAWRPTELSFYMMQLTPQFEGSNPFAQASDGALYLLRCDRDSLEWSLVKRWQLDG